MPNNQKGSNLLSLKGSCRCSVQRVNCLDGTRLFLKRNRIRLRPLPSKSPEKSLRRTALLSGNNKQSFWAHFDSEWFKCILGSIFTFRLHVYLKIFLLTHIHDSTWMTSNDFMFQRPLLGTHVKEFYFTLKGPSFSVDIMHVPVCC